MASAPHLSLSLSRELWRELLGAALPVKLAGEAFDLARDSRRALRRLGVRDRVAGLLEDRMPEGTVSRARARAQEEWSRWRPTVYGRIEELVRIRGTWRVELDTFGTDLRYSTQKVAADAYVTAVAEGTVHLLRENVEFPIRIERRIGATVALGDIRYDPGTRAIIGSVQDLGIYIGDNAVFQLVSRLAEYLLEQQLPRVNPVPILPREKVEDLFGSVGGALSVQLGVEDLELRIDERDLVLSVRFGFTRAQLTDRSGEPGSG